MTQSFVAAPTLMRSKTARIILPALMVTVGVVSFGTMFGAIVEDKLHVAVAISALVSLLAGVYHERQVTLAQQLDTPAE